MSKSNSAVLSKFSYDLTISAVVGLAAGVFASFVANNLEFLNTKFFGVTVSAPLIIVGFFLLCIVGIVVGRFLSKLLPVLYSFVKFGETGGLNWLVDMGVVNLLILVSGSSTGLYFAVFKGISFITAATNSYFLNKFWVFKGGAKQSETKEISKFVIATFMGLLVNVAIAYTISVLGPKVFTGIDSKIWANYATIAGSLTAMLFNFVLYKVWVFKLK